MRRIVTALALTAACAATVALLSGASGGGGGRSYTILLTNSFGLLEGGDLRVGGVNVGETTGFRLRTARGRPPLAEVSVRLDREGFELHEDATCEVKPQSLVGEYFLDCQPGSAGRLIPDGGELAVDRTIPTVPGDLVFNVLRQPTRQRLRVLLNELGAAAGGRSDTLQKILQRSRPSLAEATRVLEVLRRENRTIRSFIRDADRVVGEVAANRRDVSRFVVEAADASEIAASRQEELRNGVRALPEFLGELEPTATRLAEFSEAGVPLLQRLRAAGPDLDALLAQAQPFAQAGRPALRALGGASRTGTRALRAGRQEIRELQALTRDAGGTAKPLRQVLQSLDDRRRAIDGDPRARVGGPPPTDPSHAGGRGGFTGFESLANYFFWQTQSINGFDQIGHLLRGGVTSDKCTPYRNAPPRDAAERQLFEDCNSWLGPVQPGVNAADPSSPSGAASKRASAEKRDAAQPGRTPDAKRALPPDAERPAPGRPDPSKPRIGLPPAVEELLDLPLDPGLPALPGGGDGSSRDSLLDFLLGP